MVYLWGYYFEIIITNQECKGEIMINQIKTISMALSVVFFLSINSTLAGSIYDIDNPAGFDINSSVNGSFDEDHPVNYFLLSASADGQYVISYAAGDGSLQIRLYAENGGTNIISYKTESNASYYALQAGSYKISVVPYTDVKSYTMTNTYTPPTFPADIEPNDTFAQAFPLLLDGEVYGHQGYAYDAYGGMPVYNSYDSIDIWKITTEADGYFIVDSVLEETLDFDLYIYDENEQLMLGYYESDTLSNVEFQLAAGTYYIKTDYNSGYGSYMLTTSLEEAFLENDPEPNDERATAIVLPIGGEDTGHLGFTNHAHDSLTGYQKIYDTDDYWKMTTTEDGILTVATTSNVDFDSGPFMHLYIYSADGLLMNSNYNSTESLTMESSIAVAAGTYYVQVKWEGGYGSYIIACDLAPSSLASDTEPNDTKEDAVEVTLEEPVTGHLGFITDTKSGINGAYNVYDTNDYWKISYDQDTVLEITMTAEVDFEDTLSMYLYVYNEDKTLIHSDYGSDRIVITLDTLARESGHIYVHTNHVDGYGSYTLSAALSPAALAGDTNPENPNDIMANATQLPINGIGTGHLGFIKKYEDYVDYWTFYVEKEDTLYVKAISENEFGEGPVLYLKLLQENTLITDYNYDYGDTAQVSYYVSPGTYYAAVNSRSGYGSYTISVSYPSDAIPVTIITETLDDAVIGEEYSGAVEVDYVGEETVSYELLVNPSWLSISDEGVLGGTPGNEDSGIEIPVTIKVFTSDSEDILETTITVVDQVNVDKDDIPNAFHLYRPYPNPFNPTTTIAFSLAEESYVTLAVFNILGQEVAVLHDGMLAAGNYSNAWDVRNKDGISLTSGIYIIQLRTGNHVFNQKATLIW